MTDPAALSGTLILDHDDIDALLPMGACIAAMVDAFRASAQGGALLPLRTVAPLPYGAGWLGVMPSTLADPPLAGVKAITVVPANSSTPLDSHQGVVLLFEAERGQLLAVLDASRITAIRTAAVSALATNLLARPDAGDLAILGAGTQAAAHLRAMAAVRALRRVRVWNRDAGRAAEFARKCSVHSPVPIEAISDARAAVRGADIVCTVTASRDPVLRGEWLSDGAHLNAVGACRPTHRELDSAAVARARVFVDRREAALAEAGDLLIPIAERAIGPDHVAAELGDVLTGVAAGRRSAEEVTLFKSLGLAIQDLVAAHAVHRNALAAGRGVRVSIGGRRED
jgi:ornithine cyclodeaminase